MAKIFQVFLLAASLSCSPDLTLALPVDDDTPVAVQTSAAELSAEIKAWQERDLKLEPKLRAEELLALKRIVDANDQVPLADKADLITLIGAAVFYTQDYFGAAEWMAQSAAIYEAAGGPDDKIAEALNNRAVILRAIKRLGEAEVAARQSLAIRQRLFGDEHIDVASSTYNLANILYSQGRYEDAVPLIREAARQQELLAPDDFEGLVQRLTGLGSILNDSGRDDEAIDILRKAEAIGRKHLGPKHQIYAVVLHNLAINLADLGMHRQAIPIFRQAATNRVEIHGENHQWTAASLSRLAASLNAIGQLDEAEILNERALETMLEKRSVVDPGNIARVQMALADIAAKKDQWTEFENRIELARNEVDEGLPAASPERAYVHIYEASILEERGQIADALAIAEEWVPVQQLALIDTHRDRIWGELLLARLRQASGLGADSFWQLADGAIARLTNKLTDISASDRQRVSEAQTNRRSSILYLRMALEVNDRDRVFTAGQLANISDLAVGQQQSSGGNDQSGAPWLRSQLAIMGRTEVQFAQRQAVALDEQDLVKANALGSELDKARVARQELESSLLAQYPDYIERYRPRPVSIDKMTAAMDNGDVLLLAVEAEREGWIIQIDSAGGMNWRSIDAPSVTKSVAAMRASVEAGVGTSFPFRDSFSVYRAIFGDERPEAKRVLFYGGRSLASLPFAMLTSEDYAGPLASAPWLVRQASTQIVGNLALFGMKQERSAARNLDVAGIGGASLPQIAGNNIAAASLFRSGRPAMDSIADLPPLPNAARELQQIADALPGANDILLVGQDAAEEKFKATDLSGPNIIAFATHGLVAGEIRDLWEPALLLGTASPDSGEDGLLGASEIARLHLNADWVILSACNTAAGDGMNGPVYSGLATAFAQAGAKSLMLSHWRVRDDAAARLSVETVKGTASGLRRADALRVAQLAMIDDSSAPDTAHPALWAPFIIIEN